MFVKFIFFKQFFTSPSFSTLTHIWMNELVIGNYTCRFKFSSLHCERENSNFKVINLHKITILDVSNTRAQNVSIHIRPLINNVKRFMNVSNLSKKMKNRAGEMRRIMMIIYWPTLGLLFIFYDCTINLRGRTALWTVVLSVPLSFSKSLKLQRAVVTLEYVACDKRDTLTD